MIFHAQHRIKRRGCCPGALFWLPCIELVVAAAITIKSSKATTAAAENDNDKYYPNEPNVSATSSKTKSIISTRHANDLLSCFHQHTMAKACSWLHLPV
jgi:hypothetical protein